MGGGGLLEACSSTLTLQAPHESFQIRAVQLQRDVRLSCPAQVAAFVSFYAGTAAMAVIGKWA